MTALYLRGQPLATKIRAELTPAIEKVRAELGVAPTLAVLRVGSPPEVVSYARSIDQTFTPCGMGFQMHVLPEDASTETLIARLRELTRSEDVHGILLQRPLPAPVDLKAVLGEFPVHKDVEGITPQNLGYVALGCGDYPTSTPAAAMELLEFYGIPVDGKRALVIGRSDILGKPMASMLLNAHATVMIAHTHTRALAELTGQADLLIAAAGHPKLIRAEMVKPGAVVIDFGINILAAGTGGRKMPALVGDVDFDAVKEIASAITPVPGGAGPVTTMMLMRNTVHAAEHQARQLAMKGRLKWLPILKSHKARK